MTPVNEIDKAIAETIFESLGGNKFAEVAGARNIRYGKRSLIFEVASGMTIEIKEQT